MFPLPKLKKDNNNNNNNNNSSDNDTQLKSNYFIPKFSLPHQTGSKSKSITNHSIHRQNEKKNTNNSWNQMVMMDQSMSSMSQQPHDSIVAARRTIFGQQNPSFMNNLTPSNSHYKSDSGGGQYPIAIDKALWELSGGSSSGPTTVTLEDSLSHIGNLLREENELLHPYPQQLVKMQQVPLQQQQTFQFSSPLFVGNNNLAQVIAVGTSPNTTKRTWNCTQDEVPAFIDTTAKKQRIDTLDALADYCEDEPFSATSTNRFRPYQAEQWTEKFDDLLEFKEIHGHCCVPHSYKENPSLARWVCYYVG